ncbi:MAG: hypothetical protein ACLQU5_32055 [Isosphaeraceae bacterium]
MSFEFVKVPFHEFASFLENNNEVATRWEVDTNEEFPEVSFNGAYTVDELMTQIGLRSRDTDFIYVYNADIDDPDGEWDPTDYDAIPEVKANDLDDYVVRSSMGKDWLYFACSLEEGSSDRRMTLMPGGFEDGESDEDED